jgi:hypothetical protein
MKLSLRLGFAYGALFAAVLAIIGVSLFVSVRSIVAQAINAGLTDVARIAAHHVNRAVWARWELLDRNLRIVEQWAAAAIPEFDQAVHSPLRSDYPDQPESAVFAPVARLQRGVPLAASIEELVMITESEIASLTWKRAASPTEVKLCATSL